MSRFESNIYGFGDLIFLECDVIGFFIFIIIWYRDGIVFLFNICIKLFYDGWVVFLKILKFVMEDSGKYEVVV